jgi:hypothetical protein
MNNTATEKLATQGAANAAPKHRCSWLRCDRCGMGWMPGYCGKRVGSLCGDLSENPLALPCAGHLRCGCDCGCDNRSRR